MIFTFGAPKISFTEKKGNVNLQDNIIACK